MKLFKIAFLLVFTLSTQQTTFAQDWTSYQSQQQVNDLADTGNELLMATDAGLVVMNKSTFEKTFFNKANSILSNNHIQTINIVDGTTWIGTYDALISRFDGSGFQGFEAPQSSEYNPQSTELYDFKIAPNGDWWLGTNDGIFHKQGEDWFHYDETDLGDAFFHGWAIEINENGAVFVASHHVYQFSNGLWTDLSLTTELEGYNSADLYFSASGDLYFAGDLDRIGRYDGQAWEEYDFGIALNGSQVLRFNEDNEGNVYFNTQNDGIFKFVDNAWEQQSTAQLMAFDNKTDFFYIDEQNNHWLNSNIHLSVNKNGILQTTLIAPTTLESNRINNIHKGTNGHMYFMNGQTISALSSDGEWSFFPLPEALMPFENINDMLWRSENDIWLATANGLYHYTGTGWTFHDLAPCRSFTTSGQGKIYVRNEERIYIIDDTVISEYNVDNSSLSDLIISGLGLDPDGNLWIASFDWDGAGAIQKMATDGTWTTYSNVDYEVIDQPRGDFHFAADGNVWVPASVGAIQFDGTTFTNPIKDNIAQLEHYDVEAIKSDAAGKLYFANNQGLTTLMDNEWESLVIEEIPPGTSAYSTIEFDDEGTLWWASNRFGVFAYSPEVTTSLSSNFEEKTDFSIYPNPARDHVILDFTIETKAKVQVMIYNPLGQLQQSLDLGQVPAGDLLQNIQVVNFPNGFYLVQLRVNEQSLTKTLIIK